MKEPAAIVASKKNLWTRAGILCVWQPEPGRQKLSQRSPSTKKLGWVQKSWAARDRREAIVAGCFSRDDNDTN